MQICVKKSRRKNILPVARFSDGDNARKAAPFQEVLWTTTERDCTIYNGNVSERDTLLNMRELPLNGLLPLKLPPGSRPRR